MYDENFLICQYKLTFPNDQQFYVDALSLPITGFQGKVIEHIIDTQLVAKIGIRQSLAVSC